MTLQKITKSTIYNNQQSRYNENNTCICCQKSLILHLVYLLTYWSCIGFSKNILQWYVKFLTRNHRTALRKISFTKKNQDVTITISWSFSKESHNHTFFVHRKCLWTNILCTLVHLCGETPLQLQFIIFCGKDNKKRLI